MELETQWVVSLDSSMRQAKQFRLESGTLPTGCHIQPNGRVPDKSLTETSKEKHALKRK